MSTKIKYWLYENIGTEKVTQYGDSLVFDYPCESKSNCTNYEVLLPAGTYIFETWGAQGGASGGRGGYSRGIIHFSYSKRVSIFIGSEGDAVLGCGNDLEPSFNGGGKGHACTNNYKGSSGGGATDIRINGRSLNHRIIVSGGGGGSSCDNGKLTGSGGGLEGKPGPTSKPGTQNSPGEGNFPFKGYGVGTISGTFGIGGYPTIPSVNCSTYAGGGGGWYGGTSSTMGGCNAAAGGSGYVLTSSSYIPSGYHFSRRNILFKPLLIDGSSLMPTYEGEFNANLTMTGNSGSGHARITMIYQSLEMLNYFSSKCKRNQSFMLFLVAFSMKS